MSNDVFANGREISCKKADGKTICCFPDVCMTPPVCPATPGGVPIPYPNTGMAKDTAKGSRSVKITGKEIIKKNKSYFKTSYGDEPGCATPAKKGIVTGKIKGKVYFNAWSMDVKIEGKNAVRHLDITTHNHASFPGNTITWPYLDEAALTDSGHPCSNDINKEKEACKDYEPDGDPCPKVGDPPSAPFPKDCSGLDDDSLKKLKDNINFPSLRKKKGCTLKDTEIKKIKEKYKKTAKYQEFKQDFKKFYENLSEATAGFECMQARRCMLQPFKPDKEQKGCCPNQTGHHLMEASSFFDNGRGGKKSNHLTGCEGYDANKAPCVCVEGRNNTTATHGLMHTFQGATASKYKGDDKKSFTYKVSKDSAIEAMNKVFPESGCNPKCIEAQLDNYHKNNKNNKDNKKTVDIKDDTQLRPSPSGSTNKEAVENAEKVCKERREKFMGDVTDKPSME